MPPGTEEVLHKHLKAQQFFFILKGKATFIVEGKEMEVEAGQGIHILAGEVHKIKKQSTTGLELLVISEPHAHGDREVLG